MRQHGHGNVDAPGTWAYVPPRPLPYANTRLNDEQGSGFPLRRERRGTVAGGVTWAILIPVTMKIGHFHAHVWPWRGHGNSRRNGNPEPFSTSNQVRKCRKSLWMPPPRHYYEIGHFHPHVWPWRGHGNSRRNGNPEPFPTSNQVRECRKSLRTPPHPLTSLKW